MTDSTVSHGIKEGAQQTGVQTIRLTERHLTGFAQLAVLAPLHLLIREDFLQRPGQKHALGFAVLCLQLLWCSLLLLLHLSVLFPLLLQAVIFGLNPARKQVTREANESPIGGSPVGLLPQLSAAMLLTSYHVILSCLGFDNSSPRRRKPQTGSA